MILAGQVGKWIQGSFENFKHVTIPRFEDYLVARQDYWDDLAKDDPKRPIYTDGEAWDTFRDVLASG